MKTFLQTLFLFLLVTQICFAQWFQQNSGTSNQLSDVSFTDANNGTVVGDSGVILRTTNGGTDWIQQTSETEYYLSEVSFTDANNGTVVGDSGVILRTTNGGADWIAQTSGTTEFLSAVCFTDANNGTAVGSNGTIIRTTNGGADWIAQTSGTTIHLWDVSFTDANNGTAVGGYSVGIIYYCIILRTTNGGTTWTEQSSSISYPLMGVFFTDANNGTAVAGSTWGGVCFNNTNDEIKGYNSIIRTTDGGINWFEQTNPTTDYSMFAVSFTDANIGTVVGGGGIILRTTNGGTDWTQQSSGTTLILWSVSFTNANNGWLVGDNGTILHTTNGGVSFVEEEQIDEIPTEFLLSQNFPNPFNPSTKIKYSIPPVGTQHAVSVQIKIFDVLGNEVETLVNEEKPAGTYELTWSAANLPSGVYFYQLLVSALQSKDGKAGSFVQTKKMLLLK